MMERETGSSAGELEERLLRIEDLKCVQGGKMLLQNVSFTVRRGEFVSLLGPNGAGKSTLLKCVMQLMPAASGTRIFLEEKPLSRLSIREIARKIAYIPQKQGQDFPFTVRHFVEAARYAHENFLETSSENSRRLCARALEETDLVSLADRELSTLSGGELQRVRIAGALAQDAELLLLDEVTSQMDYHAREETVRLLLRLNREWGRTILTVTHDINEAVRCAGRILALRAGELCFDGRPEDFLQESVLSAIFETPFHFLRSPYFHAPVVMPTPK